MTGFQGTQATGHPPGQCDNCGNVNPADSPFCNRCGAPQTGPGPLPQASPYGTPPPPGYGAPMMAAPATNGNAIVSLVLSLSGLVCLYLIGPILGIIFGNKARKEIAVSGGRQTGDGMAQAGVIIGWILLGLSILGIIAVLALAFLGSAADTKFEDVSYCIDNPYAAGC